MLTVVSAQSGWFSRRYSLYSFLTFPIVTPVSYTHLDVYKRQALHIKGEIQPQLIKKRFQFRINILDFRLQLADLSGNFIQVNFRSVSYTHLPALSVQDMKDYGYAWAGVLPVGQEVAEKALEKGCEVYRLYSDNTEGLCVDAKEIADQ